MSMYIGLQPIAVPGMLYVVLGISTSIE